MASTTIADDAVAVSQMSVDDGDGSDSGVGVRNGT